MDALLAKLKDQGREASGALLMIQILDPEPDRGRDRMDLDGPGNPANKLEQILPFPSWAAMGFTHRFVSELQMAYPASRRTVSLHQEHFVSKPQNHLLI